MDALNFLKETKRMCNYYTSLYNDCLKCPMVDMPCGLFITDWKSDVLKTYVEKTEQWIIEHPRKTRLHDFLEKFPEAEIGKEGLPPICCARLGYVCTCAKSTCMDCWNMPVEEDE